MQVFLSRVISTAPTTIKVTGNPATDENTDLLTARVSHEDKAGGAITLTGFVRMQLGEGIEKKEDDFAAEVAKTASGG